jgi:hypothetical protein
MNKILFIGVAIFLIIHGIYSIYSAIKGGPMRGVMMPSDTFIARKLLGEDGSNRFFNLLFGLVEVIIGFIMILGKFD